MSLSRALPPWSVAVRPLRRAAGVSYDIQLLEVAKQMSGERGTSVYEQAGPVPAAIALIQASLPPALAEKIGDAYRFAEAAHAGQLRDEGTPFIEHPVRVAEILWQEMGCHDVDVVIAALNHDTVEDSDTVDGELVASKFGESVARMVLDLTKAPARLGERDRRDREYLDRLPTLDHDSRAIKLADRIDNLRSVMRSGDAAKAAWYLQVSREEFLPLAAMTDPVAYRLIAEACDAIEVALNEFGAT